MYCLDAGACGVYLLGTAMDSHLHEVVLLDERIMDAASGAGANFADLLRAAEGSEEAQRWMVEEWTKWDWASYQVGWRWRSIRHAASNPAGALDAMGL